MFFWRCLLWMCVVLLVVAVVSCVEMVQASPLGRDAPVNHRAELFFLCVDRLQRDIELGLKHGLSDERALRLCSERTESVLQSMREQGVDVEAVNDFEQEPVSYGQ